MPACLATSSRLMFAPDRVKATLAISRMRSRLRRASARGFRGATFAFFLTISRETCDRRHPPIIFYVTETLSVLSAGVAPRQQARMHRGKRMAKVFGAASTTEDVF